MNLYETTRSDYLLGYDYDVPVVHALDAAHRVMRAFSSRDACVLNIRGVAGAVRDSTVSLDCIGIIHDPIVGNNYCHWMLDWLPRILLMQEAGVDTSQINYVVARRLSRFHEETLTAIGIGRHQIVEVDGSRRDVPASVSCRKIFGLNSSGSAFRHALHMGTPSIAATMRGVFLDKPIHPTSRLILNRRSNRRLIFTETAATLLDRAGFETIYTEDMTVREQAALFNSAEAVIAPHGAGLTNILFCPEGARVMEVFPPGHSTAAFWHTAEAVGLNYACAVGRQIGHDARRAYEYDILVEHEIVSRWL